MNALKDLLDRKAAEVNRPHFIKNDPISIPHRFSKLQDIEIMGFWAAMLAWGQRATIVKKCEQLAELMDHSPYDFVKNHQEADRKRFLAFKHRTFNDLDALYFLEILQHHYRHHESLETAFANSMQPADRTVENALVGFHNYFFSLPTAPDRTRKHVATPLRKSACKRLNMFLRWMVRHDASGVDFGLWKRMHTSQLVCPLDVHVERTARQLGLLTRPQSDWLAAVELTDRLRQFDPVDPVKYDFALFGFGLDKDLA